MSQMEVIIRTIQNEVTGLKVITISFNLIIEEDVQRKPYESFQIESVLRDQAS
jgi:hypothetical protein